MINNVVVAILIFCITSIKYVIFIPFSKTSNNDFYHFIQLISFNFHLLIINNFNWEAVSNFVLWAFYGLSPHSHGSFNYFWRLFEGGKDLPNPSNSTINSLDYDLYSEFNPTNSSVVDRIEKTVEWVDTNKFLLTLMVLFLIGIVSFCLNSVCTFYRLKKRTKIANKTQLEMELLDEENNNSNSTRSNNTPKTSFFDFLMRIFLLSYCNLATITIYQLSRIKGDNIALSFLAICVTTLIIIGFPIYVTYLLLNNQHNLTNSNFKSKYGALYEYYKLENSTFMVIILSKQLLYSIIINLNEKLDFVQNTLLMIINVMFLILLMKKNPYIKNVYRVQSIIMSVCSVLIISFNYIFLSSRLILIADSVITCTTIFSVMIHILAIGSFIIACIIDYRNEKTRPRIMYSDRSEEIDSSNSLYDKNYSNPDYKI